MNNTDGKSKEVIKVTPGLIRTEIKENYTEVESYLRRHGIYITKDRKIPRWQVKKAFDLLISKLRLKMTDLTEFSGYLD